LPETCRVVILIKLEFSVSVGFIHKEFVTMHGHTILKNHLTRRFPYFLYNLHTSGKPFVNTWYKLPAENVTITPGKFITIHKKTL
jgi:hypothetical protein